MAYLYRDSRIKTPKVTRRKNWRAVVCHNGRRYWLGYWLTKEEAEAYEERFRRELLEG